jgi:hypothetical protein
MNHLLLLTLLAATSLHYHSQSTSRVATLDVPRATPLSAGSSVFP